MNALVEELKLLSEEVKDEDLANVATVSAGGNEVVCLIAKIIYAHDLKALAQL